MRTGDTLTMAVLNWKVWTTSSSFSSKNGDDWTKIPNSVQIVLYDHGNGYVTVTSGISNPDTYSLPGLDPSTDLNGVALPAAAYNAIATAAWVEINALYAKPAQPAPAFTGAHG